MDDEAGHRVFPQPLRARGCAFDDGGVAGMNCARECPAFPLSFCSRRQSSHASIQPSIEKRDPHVQKKKEFTSPLGTAFSLSFVPQVEAERIQRSLPLPHRHWLCHRLSKNERTGFSRRGRGLLDRFAVAIVRRERVARIPASAALRLQRRHRGSSPSH